MYTLFYFLVNDVASPFLQFVAEFMDARRDTRKRLKIMFTVVANAIKKGAEAPCLALLA